MRYVGHKKQDAPAPAFTGPAAGAGGGGVQIAGGLRGRDDLARPSIARKALVISADSLRSTGSATINVITLKLPDDLHAALNEVSRQRGLSKSAVVREALELSLRTQGAAAGAAERWVAKWQGKLELPDRHGLEASDPRLSHLLAKHVR